MLIHAHNAQDTASNRRTLRREEYIYTKFLATGTLDNGTPNSRTTLYDL